VNEVTPDVPVFDMYTDQVVATLRKSKERLPSDFTFTTIDNRGPFLVICVNMKDFAWRTVEQRLQIALELEAVRTRIEETGIPCVIEKN
jgi:hypothetical protein